MYNPLIFNNIFLIISLVNWYFFRILYYVQPKTDYMDRLQQLEIEVQALKQKIAELESILDTIYYMDNDGYTKRNYHGVDNHINR